MKKTMMRSLILFVLISVMSITMVACGAAKKSIVGKWTLGQEDFTEGMENMDEFKGVKS